MLDWVVQIPQPQVLREMPSSLCRFQPRVPSMCLHHLVEPCHQERFLQTLHLLPGRKLVRESVHSYTCLMIIAYKCVENQELVFECIVQNTVECLRSFKCKLHVSGCFSAYRTSIVHDMLQGDQIFVNIEVFHYHSQDKVNILRMEMKSNSYVVAWIQLFTTQSTQQHIRIADCFSKTLLAW